MFGFGRKKILMSDSVAAFVSQISQEVINHLPKIRDVLSRYMDKSEIVDDDQLCNEVFPASIAIGLQPVRNLWNEATFERARLETIHCVKDIFDETDIHNHFKFRLDEYLTAWQDTDLTVLMPHDNVVGSMLSNFGVARKMVINDTGVISPTAMMELSFTLVTLHGMFWKNIKENFKLR